VRVCIYLRYPEPPTVKNPPNRQEQGNAVPAGVVTTGANHPNGPRSRSQPAPKVEFKSLRTGGRTRI